MFWSTFGDELDIHESDLVAALKVPKLLVKHYQGSIEVASGGESIVWRHYEHLIWAVNPSDAS